MYKDMPFDSFYGIEKTILKFVIVLLEKRAKTEFLGCKL
jgi:hypothetical protein